MPPRPTRSETIRFLTLDELGRLLAATRESVRDRALFLLAYRHGLRASEVGLLRADDLDLRTLRLTVHRLKGDAWESLQRCTLTRGPVGADRWRMSARRLALKRNQPYLPRCRGWTPSRLTPSRDSLGRLGRDRVHEL